MYASLNPNYIGGCPMQMGYPLVQGKKISTFLSNFVAEDLLQFLPYDILAA